MLSRIMVCSKSGLVAVVVQCDTTLLDLTVNKENILLLLDFPMTEEQKHVLADLEHIITTSLPMVCVQADAPAATARLPGRRQVHGVLSHSSTRPSELHGMQPVSDPAANSSSMTDCVFVTLCDRWLTVSACVA